MPFSLLSSLANEIRRGAIEHDGIAPCDALEDLLARRTRDLALEDLLDIRSERQIPRRGTPDELVVQAVGDVSHLDHLCHANHMLAHAVDMSIRDVPRAHHDRTVR
jgi:hypothetical protein